MTRKLIHLSFSIICTEKYFTKYTSYKEISTKDDLYGTILSLLKDNEADPEAIKEKLF